MEPREFIKEYGIKSVVCCFSGGRDSLVATHFTFSQVEGLDVDSYVIWVDTGAAVPGVEEYVTGTAERLGWSLRILKPDVPFFERAKKWGAPTMRRRWCCYWQKLKPIMDFTKGLRPQRAEVTGLRREESRKRADLPELFYSRRTSTWKYAPIIAWTRTDVNHYVREYKLPLNPVAEIFGHSVECMCGVYASAKELRILRGRFPDFFKNFVELEESFERGGSVFWIRGRQFRAKDLLKQQTLI